MHRSASLASSGFDYARFQFIVASIAVALCATPGYGGQVPAKQANVKPHGCDEKKKNLLFAEATCTTPIEPRYGDDELDMHNEMINPYKIYACKQVKKVTIAEKKRKTRIHADFEAVIDSIEGASGLGIAGASCTEWSQQLLFKRGTLDIKALDEKGETLQANSVISGPKEHWFLGLDLPVTDEDTLEYDSDSNSLKPKENEVQLYLSLNYLFGDVLVDMTEDSRPTGWDELFDNLSFKLFVRASSRPFDSAGVGLGYRVPRLRVKKLDLDLSGLSIYGGYFWTKEDTIRDGTPAIDEARNAQWRVGVTFDIESMIKAVKW